MMTRIKPILYLLATGCLICSSGLAADEIDFNRQIRPLLSRHCIACHGPDEGDRQADLRLDTFEGATDYAIIPGDAEGSDAMDRITTDDVDMRMPPADHASALKSDEIELLRTWIDEGAKYQTHWAFGPLQQSTIPEVLDLAKVAGDQVPKINNSIDNFILKSAYRAGLKQNPTSSTVSLVRRVSVDLTGLPPISHGEPVQNAISRYLADPDQSNFEKLVDQLLATPSYAEHWAAMWLDLARYADTCGYSGDEQRDIWPWRDWLIRSLEANKSYKDLSIEMLAGDLLPAATTDQRLATAFHRNTLSNNEGGTDDEEFRTIAVKDRLSTTLNVWMGLTVRCAECHSHKYDPISHVEYYQLLDFFNQTVDADNRDDRPKLEVNAMGDPVATAKLTAQIAELQKQLEGQPEIWHHLRPQDMTSRSGTKFELLDDDSILATGPKPKIEEYAFTFEVAAGTTVRAIRLECLPHVQHNGNVGRSAEGAFILSQIRLAKIESDAKDENESEVLIPFSDAANDFNQDNRHARTSIQSEVETGGDQGWSVKHPVSGYSGRHEAIFELKEPLVADQSMKFKVYLLHDPPWPGLNLGCVRISVCDVENAVAKYDQQALDQHRRELTDLAIQLTKPVRVPVLEERPVQQRRETYVNIRGNFQSKGEKVSAQFPEAFAVANELSLNRLGLAQWLFHQENSLTARVAVNRYWARMMGTGLVLTEEDFGTQGTPPTHPELLDHLAIDFRDGGWDVHALLKEIAMSATYQQSQNVTSEMLDIDPRNRLLARGPRIRLSAEVVRDQALAVSGLLSKKLYGQPVYPPNPIKRVVNAFTGGMEWQESEGEDRYRRAIYTFLKRSAPHPLFETFDMASRDVCSMRRQVTNTPLQSFMTLNDITFIEAAQALADQMLSSSNDQSFESDDTKISSQIAHGLQAALYVPADVNQTEVLSRLYKNGTAMFETDIQGAAEMIGRNTANFDPQTLSESEKVELVQRAAMTVVSNVILNLDSFLNN